MPYNRPGHWNMPCPTRVGMLGGWDGKPLAPSRLTKDEQVTHISLWCLWSAPIIIGCPIDLLDDWTLALLTNDEMLDITVTWAEAGLSGPCMARDLWAYRDLGIVNGSFTARAVPQHGCRVIRFVRQK